MRNLNLCFVFILSTSLMFLGGCATSRTAGWNQAEKASSLDPKESKALQQEAKKNWDKRDDKEKLSAALAAYEKLIKSDPNDYASLAFLSRGYYLLADGHTDNMEEKKRLWEMGVGFGERAMATNQAFKEKMLANGGKVEEALDVLTKDQIDGIYWTAVNLGKWGKNSGIATVLKYKSRIKMMINRVGELDKNYFFGAFDRYWGAYYAIAPGFAGGDIKKSLESFEKSVKTEKNYLGTYVLVAELYATKKGDKELFKEKLNYVLKAKTDVVPAIAPENVIEQRKAKKLLADMDNLF